MTTKTTTADSRRATGGGYPAWLVCLLLLTFVIGTDDFVIAGVLGPIAGDLDVSEAAAGQLVTVFSLTYAVAAPLMAVITARLPRRTLMITGMLVFAALNALAALAPTYAVLLACRVLAALTASMMTPAAFVTTAALAPPEKAGRFMGVVTAGLTFSLVIGVPGGTWLGGWLGWRSTMLLIVALALVVAAGLARFMPVLAEAPALTLRQRLAPLTSRAVVVSLVAMVPAAVGGYMAFVYIAPVAAALSGVSTSGLALLIAVIGVAGIAGAWLGGRGTDRWGPDRTILLALGVQVTATLVLPVLAWLWPGRVPMALTGLVLVCWQIGGWAFNAPIQTRLTRIAGPSGGEAVALNISAMYLGIAIAGAAGGMALSGGGAAAVLIVGGAFALLGLLAFAAAIRGPH
ncbi:MFS transporter [Nonomuraea sp. K274]|uniref:MFS transporter n=1 Tax=Nonomuraea cypriaca TaxID=1187855 RepID=A0A931F1Y2_9ACTN|nr:MFS transporter [Nonomuraea cypriaca]MBF8188616.1 MFS transporter [Nonomuraea cypriaca]